MTRAQVSWGGHLLMWTVLGTLLTGCGSFNNPDLLWGSRMGFRPDQPTFRVSTEKANSESTPKTSCDLLNDNIVYASNLKEAYRVRATQNRSWIYVAAITGLGVAAASGALAAATAVAAGTLALLAISGGFTADAFATINNSELANVYTVAANDIGTSLACTEIRLGVSTRDQDLECRTQLAYLTLALSNARNTLETARTSSAAGALARASAQKTLLDQEINKVQDARDAADKAEAARRAQAALAVAAKETQAAEGKASTASGDGQAQAAHQAAIANETALTQVAKTKAQDAADAEAKLRGLACPPLPALE
jgi:hypothetical protein